MRPKRLDDLLESLGKLHHIDGLDINLIIADNDDSASAQAIVEKHKQSFPYPIIYIVEPTRGIAVVRNRLFSEAYALGSDFIVTIDDDATADSSWLYELVKAAQVYDADAVGGPAFLWVDYPLPDYISEMLHPFQQSSGSPVLAIGTGNALFRVAAVRTIEGPFDLRFNLTGGEDTALSASMVRNGFRIVWCESAVVREYLPKSRGTIRYYLKRGFTNGMIPSRIVLLYSPTNRRVAAQFIRALGRLGMSSLQFFISLPSDRKSMLKHAVGMAYGLGGIFALLLPTMKKEPYSTIHGE